MINIHYDQRNAGEGNEGLTDQQGSTMSSALQPGSLVRGTVGSWEHLLDGRLVGPFTSERTALVVSQGEGRVLLLMQDGQLRRCGTYDSLVVLSGSPR